jgi:hypothetical protein
MTNAAATANPATCFTPSRGRTIAYWVSNLVIGTECVVASGTRSPDLRYSHLAFHGSKNGRTPAWSLTTRERPLPIWL